MTMNLVLFSLLAYATGCFVYENRRRGTYSVSPRAERFSKGLDRLLLFVPVLAAAIFAVLFRFVLKGRFYERLSHAALVLALWLFAARFYWFLISFSGHWKKTHGSIFCTDFSLCLAGMLGAVCSAIYLTPLDRYVNTVHSVLGPASLLAGACLLAVFYAAAYLSACFRKDKQDSDEPDRPDRSGR